MAGQIADLMEVNEALAGRLAGGDGAPAVTQLG
jgi:hypothetical protein